MNLALSTKNERGVRQPNPQGTYEPKCTDFSSESDETGRIKIGVKSVMAALRRAGYSLHGIVYPWQHIEFNLRLEVDRNAA